MKRRAFLAGTILTLTGCIQTSSSGVSENPTTSLPATQTERTTNTGPSAQTASETPASIINTPTRATTNRSAANPVCPPVDTVPDRTICYRTKPTDAPVWLSVAHSNWNVDPTDNAVETNVFTLHNDSDASLRFNPHDWELYKRTDTGWSSNIRQSIGSGVVTVDPDERYRWSFSRVWHPSPNAENTEYITIQGRIDEGTYAFVIGVPAPTGESWIACLARFTLNLV